MAIFFKAVETPSIIDRGLFPIQIIYHWRKKNETHILILKWLVSFLLFHAFIYKIKLNPKKLKN